ncbi:MAG: peroxide stress protein YaaA, partial [Kangiella sp.]|nr:peroxide stress protein YaaA [Kangiella sp.]
AQLSAADLDYAQTHFRILSGLYGLLKPMDLIKAHRLEMGTKLGNEKGADLYAFWGTRIANLLSEDCAASGGANVIVNCASVEYFKSVDRKALAPDVLTPVFKEEKAGVAKIVSFYAKKARGMMARYMIQNRIDRPEGLKDFNEEGYVFRPALSDEKTYVFTRLVD